jgi:protocatechuate 3,4-dioxygenase beta subunit
MPRTLDVFVSEEGAVETVDGEFTLKHLPAGTETLKIVHPMYAFSISEGIEVVAGRSTEGVKIVLKKGATVEGHVYDADGEPEAGVALYIQDMDSYVGSGDEQEGRLGAAITDSNGFYRISGLPEKMCSVRREKEWQSLGVVRRAIMPKSGEVSRLDMGGTPVVTGTIVVDNEPLVEKRILLGPVDSSHFGLFRCYAKTDADGRFAFRGAVDGPHAIYYENPDKRGDWIKIAHVDVANTDLNLGVITPANVSRLLVTIDERQFDTKLAVRQIYISKAGKVFGVPVGIAEPPGTETEPWTINDVEPGKYVLNLTRSDQVQIRKEIKLAPDQSQWEVTMEIPESTAGVSGKIVGNTPSGLAFWREGMDVFGAITMGREGAYKIENLPSGTYFIGSVFDLLNNMSKLAEFELLPGRNEIVDLDLSGHVEQKMAYLVAQIMDERHQFRDDIEVWLQRDSQPIETWQSTPQGHIFLTIPGKYVLHVAAQGYKKIEKPVVLKAIEPGVGQPKTMLVHLEKE